LRITDPEMTRFWLTVDQGVQFVIDSLRRMHGGETFIPKIPSMRIVDLAQAMAPDCRQEITGIRPGEKLHEVMIPIDEARQTREFDSFYIIQPSLLMWEAGKAHLYDGHEGVSVDKNFSYTSDNNSEWVDAATLQTMISDEVNA